MNNKKLVWKYFWEQKKEEVFNVIKFAFIIFSIFGPFLALTLGATDLKNEWAIIISIITTSFWIVYGLIYWIRDNWKRANQRVIEEKNGIAKELSDSEYEKEKEKRLPYGVKKGDYIYYKDRWLKIKEAESNDWSSYDLTVKFYCGIEEKYDFENLNKTNVRYAIKKDVLVSNQEEVKNESN